MVGCTTIIQDMITELFEHLETDNRILKNENNSVWVLAKLKIHFNKYPIWKQKVQATSFITNKSKIRVQNNTKVEDEAGKVLFVAKQESCPIDLTTKKIRKIETIRFPLDKEFIEQFKDFIEQLEANKIQEECEKITNTEDLINEIKSMECLDTEKLKEIAYRLDLFDSEYTFELKEQIIDRVKVIEFNNFGNCYTFESIQKELIDMISDIATDYGVNLDEIEESR